MSKAMKINRGYQLFETAATAAPWFLQNILTNSLRYSRDLQ